MLSLPACAALVLACSFAGGAQAGSASGVLPKTGIARNNATAAANEMARWVGVTQDNQRLPFVIVDKKSAQAFVFDAKGQLKGATPVLLGLTVGDQGLTDMAGRDVASLLPAEKTTPAGRFAAEPGRNLQGEHIIWMNYAAQLAIHRLRPDHQQERRAQRLATASATDNRISAGCVIVPARFYDHVIEPLLGNHRSVVYVLPETRSLQSMINAMQASSF